MHVIDKVSKRVIQLSIQFTLSFQLVTLLQTPFVRQNTPHPKELKAKAHKLFSKGKNDSRSGSTDEQVPVQFAFFF